MAENTTGFEKSGYIVKKGTPDGDNTKFNVMPPGQDIEDQPVKDIRAMPLKTVTGISYPGDGWGG